MQSYNFCLRVASNAETLTSYANPINYIYSNHICLAKAHHHGTHPFLLFYPCYCVHLLLRLPTFELLQVWVETSKWSSSAKQSCRFWHTSYLLALFPAFAPSQIADIIKNQFSDDNWILSPLLISQLINLLLLILLYFLRSYCESVKSVCNIVI